MHPFRSLALLVGAWFPFKSQIGTYFGGFDGLSYIPFEMSDFAYVAMQFLRNTEVPASRQLSSGTERLQFG